MIHRQDGLFYTPFAHRCYRCNTVYYHVDVLDLSVTPSLTPFSAQVAPNSHSELMLPYCRSRVLCEVYKTLDYVLTVVL